MREVCEPKWGPVEFQRPIGWQQVVVGVVSVTPATTRRREGCGFILCVCVCVCVCVFRSVFNHCYDEITYRASRLFSDQHPWLEERNECGHFPEAVQEVSRPPASLPERRAASLKLSGKQNNIMCLSKHLWCCSALVSGVKYDLLLRPSLFWWWWWWRVLSKEHSAKVHVFYCMSVDDHSTQFSL